MPRTVAHSPSVYDVAVGKSAADLMLKANTQLTDGWVLGYPSPPGLLESWS